MRSAVLLTRATALFLVILLVACGSTHHNIAPADADELTRFVLFIRELPDGTVTHSWQRAEEVDLSSYGALSGARSAARGIRPVVARPRDCFQEFVDCVDECKARPLARGYGHITSSRDRKKRKEEHCRKQCWQPYQDCSELQELKPQEFTAVDSAVDWLKRNRKAVLVGSVVIVAGVAFVVLSAGAGVVVLAPVVLLAAPAAPSTSWMAEASP
ncbi:hypothetical protein ACLESO_30660 [Pyxidicoccus sp. 3LG]